MGEYAAGMAMDSEYDMEPMEFSEDMAYVNPDLAKKKMASQGAAGAASKGAMGGAGGIAAMMALQAYSNAKASQQKERDDKYKAQLDHRNSMSSALDGLIATTRGLRL